MSNLSSVNSKKSASTNYGQPVPAGKEANRMPEKSSSGKQRLDEAKGARAPSERVPRGKPTPHKLANAVLEACRKSGVSVEHVNATASKVHALQRRLHLSDDLLDELLADKGILECLSKSEIKVALGEDGKFTQSPQRDLIAALLNGHQKIAGMLICACPARSLYNFCCRILESWGERNFHLLPEDAVVQLISRAAKKAAASPDGARTAELRKLCSEKCPEYLNVIGTPVGAESAFGLYELTAFRRTDPESGGQPSHYDKIVSDGFRITMNFPDDVEFGVADMLAYIRECSGGIRADLLQMMLANKIQFTAGQRMLLRDLVKSILRDDTTLHDPSKLKTLLPLVMQELPADDFANELKDQLKGLGTLIAKSDRAKSDKLALEMLEYSQEVMDLLKMTGEQRFEWAKGTWLKLTELLPRGLLAAPRSLLLNTGLFVIPWTDEVRKSPLWEISDKTLQECKKLAGLDDLNVKDFIGMAVLVPGADRGGLWLAASARGMLREFPLLDDEQTREYAAFRMGLVLETHIQDALGEKLKRLREDQVSNDLLPTVFGGMSAVSEILLKLMDIGDTRLAKMESLVDAALNVIEPWSDLFSNTHVLGVYQGALLARLGVGREEELLAVLLGPDGALVSDPAIKGVARSGLFDETKAAPIVAAIRSKLKTTGAIEALRSLEKCSIFLRSVLVHEVEHKNRPDVTKAIGAEDGQVRTLIKKLK